ncbi:MAG: glucose-1-phosphate thymidylyltransferase RfbA [Burkholderiaceae bacterium]
MKKNKLVSNRKGIVLAGGSGTRLYPNTLAISKQLIPIYDKPLIYYPLSVLMLANIRDILLISTQKDITNFQNLLGDGENFGLSISYATQDRPEGIAQAFLIGEEFIKNNHSALILGDNIFYGSGLEELLSAASGKVKEATIFGYPVENPQRFGVAAVNNGKVTSIIEKPKFTESNIAVTGLYFFDNNACSKAKELAPSKRGELEITDLNLSYLKDSRLNIHLFGRGFAWFDTGTPEALVDASVFIRTIEQRQGLKICCPEEIAWKKGWIDDDKLQSLANNFQNNSYGQYLEKLLKEKF